MGRKEGMDGEGVAEKKKDDEEREERREES